MQSLQDYTFISRYARFIPELSRRETWDEAVNRVRDMHLRKYPQISDKINWAFELMREKRVLGSQRALQFGGPPVEKKNARLYNCTVSFCDRPRFFQESFWLLLCGCGVGFSVQKHHIDKLPIFGRRYVARYIRPHKTHVIEDSIEGWSDSVGVLLDSYFNESNYDIRFDYSNIRPEGAVLSSSSGKAPGPKPLEIALEAIRGILNRCLEDGQNRLRPIDAYDIVMYISAAVLSGGVRRSASICLFSPDDTAMAQAKTGKWFSENPQRSYSNNSAVLLRSGTTKQTFDDLMQYVKEFGEPGFYWTDSTEQVPNPCV